MEDRTIHYSNIIKMTRMYGEGQGACGEFGEITGYAGLVTCEECRRTAQAEQREYIMLVSLPSTQAQ